MSWTIESFDVSGYTTGATGIQINEGLFLHVSGITYDGTTITNSHIAYTTGIGFITSGITEISGNFYYDDDNNRWESVLSVTDAAEVGNQGSGCLEWYWNSGATSASYADDSTGIVVFANAAKQAWDDLSNTDGSVDNADSQHTHTIGDDLGDHTATQDLDMANNNIDDIASIDGGGDDILVNDDLDMEGNSIIDCGYLFLDDGFLRVYTSGGGADDMAHFRDVDDANDLYLRYDGTDWMWRSEGGGGGNLIFEMDNKGSWVRADDYYEFSRSLPEGTVLYKLTKIKNKEDGSLDHQSFPKDVQGEDEGKYLGVSLSKQVKYLIKANQELFNLLQGVKNENDTLKTQLKDLESRIAALEK